MIDLFPDFRDLLVELADAGADFVVVGGHAVAFHGHTRATKELEVLVRPTAENAQRVYRTIEGRSIPVIGIEALLRAKRAAGRTQDLADVEALEAIERERAR